MKEAVGQTISLQVILVFMVFLNAFLAFSVNYTKAFRAKNGIIDLIEQHEGYTFYNGTTPIDNLSNESLNNDKSVQAQAFGLIKSMGYDYGDSKSNGIICNNDGSISDASIIQKADQPGGFCLYRICNNDGTVRYKVVTYVMMKFPVINFGISIPIKGETKTLYYEVNNAFNNTYSVE